MPDIFLSYAKEDVDRITPLVSALESNNWTVFWDRHIPPGQRWDEYIEAQLDNSKCVIVAWSKNSIKSDWVKDEAQEGLERNILKPIIIEDVRPPMGFRRVQFSDLRDWDKEADHSGFFHLFDELGTLLGTSSPQQTPSTELKNISNSRPKQSLAAGTVFNDRLKNDSLGPDMVVIPAGTFRMGDLSGTGDESEGPAHEVTFVQPFAMGRYAVSFDEYDRFARETGVALPGDKGWGRGDRPVINVSWLDAVAYCEWLSQQTGCEYRLPSEAEWEYAARAGTTTKYWWGDDIGRNKTNGHNSGSETSANKTAPVSAFDANPWGLYNVHGNVWEWLEDSWHENYAGAPKDGSAWGEGDDSQRVLRGGSWFVRPGSFCARLSVAGTLQTAVSTLSGFVLFARPPFSAEHCGTASLTAVLLFSDPRPYFWPRCFEKNR